MTSTNLVDVTAACALRGKLSTIGVVVDKLDAVKTKGSSWCITFTIKDNDFDGPSWQGGLKVKIFNDDPNLLPAVQQNDVVLLRNIRINSFQDRPTGVAGQNDTVHWAIFRPRSGSGGNLSIIHGPVPFQSTSNEKRVATELLAKIHDGESFATTQSSPQPVQPVPVSQQSFRNVQSSASTPKPSHLPFSLIQDVKAGRLTQLLGQVVKMNTYDSNKTLIYLTDYTVNESLVDIRKDDEDAGVEGDAYGYLSRKKQNWPGPWGQLSIQVALWEPHASFAREYVKEGNLVHLTYVHVKDDRSGGIEAAVHKDKRFGDKIHVRIISEEYDERARDLMERRKAYWKIHGKPSADRKKAEKKAEKQKNNKQESKEARREEGQTGLPKPTAQKKINRYIKCRDHGIPPLHDLDSILSAKTHINNIGGDITYKLPFQNICYRPLVRVVDFYPPNLKDFAVKVNVNPIVGYGEGEDDLGPRYTTWDWRFCLLVEGTEPIDPKQQPRELMKIFVTGGEGTHLLGLDPDDLRSNKRCLHELREKLFILWGDLEERKREAAATAPGDDESWVPVKTSAVPFVCCIKEYGVECGHKDPDAMSIDGRYQDMCSQPGCFGWERRFALFGTTIHS